MTVTAQYTVPKRYTGAEFARALRAVVSAEFAMQRRDTRLPLGLVLCAGLCLLVTPPANASYSLLRFGGFKPEMSAGTQLIVAGAVLGLFLFPLFLLRLGAGHGRDRELAVEHLLTCSPLDTRWAAGARIFANAVFVLAFSVLMLILLSVAVASRTGHVPGGVAVAGFLLVLIPAGLLSLPAAAALDFWFGKNRLLKTVAAFAAYLLLLGAAVSETGDVFGLSLLKQNWPAGAAKESFAIGIVAAPNGPGIPWNIGSIPQAFVAHQAVMLAIALAGAVAVSYLARFNWKKIEMPFSGTNEGIASLPARFPSGVTRLKPRKIGYARAALAQCGRWLMGAKWLSITAATAFVVSALHWNSARPGAAIALLIPLFIANRGGLTADGPIRAVDLSSPGLWFPTPVLFRGTVLAAITAASTIPVLVGVRPLYGVHLLLGIVASSLWLSWACLRADRTLSGISIYVLIWYLETFCDMPAKLDLLGLAGSSWPALAETAVACIVLAAACVRADREDGRRPLFRMPAVSADAA